MEYFLNLYYNFISLNDEDYGYDFDQLTEDFLEQCKNQGIKIPFFINKELDSKEIELHLKSTISDWSSWHEHCQNEVINSISLILNK